MYSFKLKKKKKKRDTNKIYVELIFVINVYENENKIYNYIIKTKQISAKIQFEETNYKKGESSIQGDPIKVDNDYANWENKISNEKDNKLESKSNKINQENYYDLLNKNMDSGTRNFWNGWTSWRGKWVTMFYIHFVLSIDRNIPL